MSKIEAAHMTARGYDEIASKAGAEAAASFPSRPDLQRLHDFLEKASKQMRELIRYALDDYLSEPGPGV